MATVLVTGGSGTLGRLVVRQLVDGGHHVRVLSRHATPGLSDLTEVVGGDLVSGVGLHAAVANVDAIVHCASAPQDAQAVDVAGTRRLVEAARATGAPHMVYPSIVGADRSTYGYYQAKVAAEGTIQTGGLPWTIVRATQFHELVCRLIRSFGADTEAEVAVVAGMRFQSIDASEFAAVLVSLVEQGPAGRTPDVGGPQIRSIEALTEAYLRSRGRKATIRSVTPSDELFDAFRSGINLVLDHAVGKITWEVFLRNKYAQTSSVYRQ
ncbi:MAG: NAD(P)H-binding protein [Herpetosiphon sp.]